MNNMGSHFSWQKYPCVLKAGHCHGGAATARLENQSALQDAAGLLTGSSSDVQCYCTLEPYIDAKFDIHIQKIGTNYKAFMRKSISGNWKTNQGSAMLEQIAMTEKYKGWLNELSDMFGGLEVCGLSIAVAKDGREFILGASDSTLQLMGDTQEDDRRQIADIVVSRMQNVCRPQLAKTASRSSISSRGGSPTDENVPPAPAGPRPASTSGPPPPIPERTTPGPGSIGRHGSLSSVSSEPPEQPSEKAPTLSNVGRRDSQASQSSTVSSVSTSRQTPQRQPQGQTSVAEDAEDTMKNLRKTFAGIFGDIAITIKPSATTDTTESKTQNLPSITTNTEESSATSAITSVKSDNEPSFTATSSSTVFCNDEPEIIKKPDFKPMERVNPFDKNSVPTKNTSTDVDDSFEIIDSKFKSSYASSDTSKNSYAKIPETKGTPPSGAYASATGKCRREIRSHSIATNNDSPKYGYKGTSSDSFSAKGNYEEPKSHSSLDSYKSVSNKFTRSSGSLSDADIIFGDLKNKAKNTSDYSSYRSSTESDSVFGKSESNKTSFDKSVPSYKIYDGIQNHAFTDFDSPKSSGLSTTDDEDYDLK
ncbi:Synapsin [Pseudolycoriella hygida]|uniref:Synapsin n=1 Tax=Pseudolycoriella hygida TaxID=35572 RepID=A0A9Q0MYE8_9DIPT|nr:Synapsin [Pseudolycoriella hygida]